MLNKRVQYIMLGVYRQSGVVAKYTLISILLFFYASQAFDCRHAGTLPF